MSHIYTNHKNYRKVKDLCHYTDKYRRAAHSICNLKYSIPREIPAVFHNKSNYDYHFTIKKLEKEFEGEFNCLGANTEKYKSFSLPVTKEVKRTDKDGEETIKPYLANYNLLIEQHSWQAHYQIFLIILLK